MKISFENADKVNGLMTITVEEADYKDEVEKTLKDYRKRANVPGFRQGQVPVGLIKRQYGPRGKDGCILSKILVRASRNILLITRFRCWVSQWVLSLKRQ